MGMIDRAGSVTWDPPRPSVKAFRATMPNLTLVYMPFVLTPRWALWVRVVAVLLAWLVVACFQVLATRTAVTVGPAHIQIGDRRVRWEDVEAVGDERWPTGWAGDKGCSRREPRGWVLTIACKGQTKFKRLPATARWSRDEVPSALALVALAPSHVVLLGRGDPTVSGWRRLATASSPQPRATNEWAELEGRIARVRGEIDEVRSKGATTWQRNP